MASPPASPAHLAGGRPAEHGDFILRRRFRLVQRLAPPSGGVLLDFGCGTGGQTLHFAPHFDAIVGADVDTAYLGAFRQAMYHGGMGSRATAVRYDGHRLPLRDGCVDYAISFEVLEHVASEHDALRELRRVIRPGGTLALSVPNRWWIFETHGAALPLLPWNRVPFFSWLPKRLHDRWAHARIYRRREIVETVRAYGLEVDHALYITAPMDALRWPWLQRALRATVFRADGTALPWLSTAILVVARRLPG